MSSLAAILSRKRLQKITNYSYFLGYSSSGVIKMRGKALVFALLLAVVFPWFMILVLENIPGDGTSKVRQQMQTDGENRQRREDGYEPLTLPVILGDGNTQTMALEDYLVGVVLGEMPADFSQQALMAQAVVARTYTLKHSLGQGKHDGGALCTDSGCCQAYRAPEDFLASGGSTENLERIMAAVADTQWQVLLYDGELIDATYFSCSGGRTEDAVAVWGQDVPYLQAVDSPGEEGATHFVDTVRFSVSEFAQKLGIDHNSWALGAVTYTDGGGVATMQIGGKTFTGVELRQLLGLRSTSFIMSAVGDQIIVTTRGFGHRVGMSQYGADAMAVRGSAYDAILAHYYPGTTLETWDAAQFKN